MLCEAALKFWSSLWRVGPQHRQDPQRCCYCWTLSSLSLLFPCLIQHFLLSHALTPLPSLSLLSCMFPLWPERAKEANPGSETWWTQPPPSSVIFSSSIGCNLFLGCCYGHQREYGTSGRCVCGICRPCLCKPTHSYYQKKDNRSWWDMFTVTK